MLVYTEKLVLALPNSLFGYTRKNFVTKTEFRVGLYWENFKIFKKNQIHVA